MALYTPFLNLGKIMETKIAIVGATMALFACASTANVEAGLSPDGSGFIYSYERMLAAQGYQVGIIDGVFDDQMHDAITAFEKEHNLPVTGLLSAERQEQIVMAASGHAPIPLDTDDCQVQPGSGATFQVQPAIPPMPVPNAAGEGTIQVASNTYGVPQQSLNVRTRPVSARAGTGVFRAPTDQFFGLYGYLASNTLTGESGAEFDHSGLGIGIIGQYKFFGLSWRASDLENDENEDIRFKESRLSAWGQMSIGPVTARLGAEGLSYEIALRTGNGLNEVTAYQAQGFGITSALSMDVAPGLSLSAGGSFIPLDGEESATDSDATELFAGVSYRFQSLSAFAEYRISDLDYDDGTTEEISDIRAGLIYFMD